MTTSASTIRHKRIQDIRATGDPASAIDRYVLEGGESGGTVAVVEHRLAPHVLAAPVHRHSREDEYSLVLEGRLGVWQDDDEVIATAGELVIKPRNHWHTFFNAGDEPLRVLELIVPGGLEELFITLAALGDYDPETLPALAHQYGCDVDFARTEPLVERHGLHF